MAHQAFGILIYLIIGDNGASAEGSLDYTAHASKFNGRISWVQIDLGKDGADADRFIDDEECVHVIMARQLSDAHAVRRAFREMACATREIFKGTPDFSVE